VTTRISKKGQVTVPAEIRQQDDVQPGQEFELQRIRPGDYRLRRRKVPNNEGVVDWLLSCPSKGFFVSLGSESTDMLAEAEFEGP